MDKSWSLLLDPSEMKQNSVAEENTAYAAGTVSYEMFSIDDQNRIESLANSIDISDANETVLFGSVAQKNISDFSVEVLKKVKTSDLGDIGKALRDLTIQLDATTEEEPKGIRKVFHKAQKSIDTIKANYAKAEANVDRIESDMDLHLKTLSQDVSMYQQMYDLNIQYYKELTMYIIAGKKALDNARGGKLKELQSRAEMTNQPEDVQFYRDFSDQCNRFEKKLSDLELTRMIAIQSAPQIRLLQNNDREMMDKIQSSLSNTIPLWRNQLVLSLGIEHSRRAAEAQNELSDRTNRLLEMNAEKLKMATVETAKAIETPIVDVETLKHCNVQLIESLKEVVRIHNTGMERQEKVKQELISIETELKQALLESQWKQ